MHSFDFTQGSVGSVQSWTEDGRLGHMSFFSPNGLNVRPTRLWRIVWKNKYSSWEGLQLCFGCELSAVAPYVTFNMSGLRNRSDTNVASMLTLN